MEHIDTHDVEVAFDDLIKELSKLKAKFAYKMTCRGQVVCLATSLHCFLDENGRPVAIEDRFPAFYEELLKLRDNSL